jgi:hypothetical protein
MTTDNLTAWDWLVREWHTPRWRRSVRLLAAALLAVAGGLYLLKDAGSGNWIPLFAGAVVLLILGLRIEVPDEPLPVLPDGIEATAAESAILLPAPAEAAVPAAVGQSAAQSAPAAAAVAEPRGTEEAGGLMRFLRLPLAALTAVSAQYLMDARPIQIDEAHDLGWLLYAVAFLLLGWALFSGDAAFLLGSGAGNAKGIRFNYPRLGFFIGALLFGGFAYLGSAGGLFTVLGLVSLAVAFAYWWVAFAEYSGSFAEAVVGTWNAAGRRLRSAGASLLSGITLSSWSLLVVACFAGLVFTRTYAMNAIPPEMTSDHVEKLTNVVGIFNGETYIFFANNGGREALQFYLVALVARVFGTGISFLSLKIVSVAVGILTLPFMYLLGKEIADRRVGLLAMILVGVGYWPDMISRIGLRLPLAMLFCAATLYFFFRAIRRREWNCFLWAGVALGIGMYGYTSIRIVPVALAVVTAAFLLHSSSGGARRWAIGGFFLTLGTTALLFIPFLRYAVDYPADFWLRTTSRLIPAEGASLPQMVNTFFNNLWLGLQMFSWNDGVGWFNCVPLRPALDVITGGLFHIGLIGLVAYGFKTRSWQSFALVLLVPVLLLPSTLALAIPNENPSLARAVAAVPVVFLIGALALVMLADFLRRLIPGGSGRWAVAGFLAAAVAIGAAQDFDLTLRQYPETYRMNSENASELGEFMREFVASIGRPEDVYLVPYPYWVDDRIMNIAAGFPIDSQHYVFPENIPDFAFSGRPTLFLLLAADSDSLAALIEKFPEGYYATKTSAFPGKDFVYFVVPGVPGAEAQ